MPQQLRTVLTWVLGVLAVLALTLSAVAVWARTTVRDGAKFGDIAGDVIDDPAVNAALSERLADEVMSAANVDQLVSDALSGRELLSRLQTPIEAGIRSFLAARISNLLENERVQRLVSVAVVRAHDRALQLLRGDGLVAGISVDNGEVSVNLLPLIGLAVGQLQDMGLGTNFDVPDLSRDGDPAAQIAALSKAIGRPLPEDFGQLVVYRSDEVQQAQETVKDAQRIVAFSIRAFWLLLAVAVLSIAGTLLLARHRWRTLLVMSLGTVAAMIMLRSGVHRLLDEAPKLAKRPAGAATARIVLDGLTQSLLRLSAALALIALVCIVVSLVRGRWARTDIEVTVGVVLGVAVVALLGISIVSVVLGLVVGIASVPLGRALIKPGPSSAGADPPASAATGGSSGAPVDGGSAAAADEPVVPTSTAPDVPPASPPAAPGSSTPPDLAPA